MTSVPSQRRRDRGRTTVSVVKTVAASAAVAYGAYCLAQWYWKDENEEENKNEERKSNSEEQQSEDLPTSAPSLQASSMTSSWLSVATDWLVDAAHSSVSTSTIPAQNPPPQSQSHMHHHPPITGKTRRQRLMHCRQKTITAFTACLPALQGVVEDITSTSQATRHLKELRKKQKEMAENHPKNDSDEVPEEELQSLQQQQDELWKVIVVENTTRMMASSYTYALLLLSLTVQLHWISGNREMLLHEGQQSDGTSTELAQSMLMQSHQYLVESGIPLLVKTIRRTVEATMLSSIGAGGDWTKPTQFMSIQDVGRLLYQRIPHALKYGSSTGSSSIANSLSRNWVRFVLPDEECFDPIWDVCCSPVWVDAQEEVLEMLWYKVLRDHETDGWKWLFENTSEMEYDLHPHQKPVAKIVAQFKKSSNLIFAEVGNDNASPRASNSNNLLISLQKLPTVLELGEVSFQRHS